MKFRYLLRHEFPPPPRFGRGGWSLRALFCLLALTGAARGGNWPQFRGPGADGRAVGGEPPLQWSEQERIRWKTPIHDHGHSSPVVWEDQVWVTTATKDGQRLFAVACDRATGRIVHDIPVFTVAQPEKINAQNTYATPTPVIEAGRLYVHFGTYGTACLDTKTGRKLWERVDLHCQHLQGPASSPILFGDLLILDFSGGDVQFVVALDKATGRTVWQQRRSLDLTQIVPLMRKDHCTPIVIEVAGRPQLISPSARAAYAYDPATGEELWQVRHGGDSVIFRPVVGHGLVFLSTGFTQFEIWAVRPDGRGDVTASHVVWKHTKDVPRRTSPALVGDRLYLLEDTGPLTCLQAVSGEVLWRKRLAGQFAASPVATADRLYCFDQKGRTTVLALGGGGEVLSENILAEGCYASPAAVDGSLFLRGSTHLYRID
jgi:outer membrane protein assembly factor BamB